MDKKAILDQKRDQSWDWPQREPELVGTDHDHAVAHGQAQQQRRRMNTMGRTSQPTVRQRRHSHDAAGKARRFLINVPSTLRLILDQEDTDHNCQITVQDLGPKNIAIPTLDSDGYNQYEVRGTYHLSNLLQELTLANRRGRKTITLDESRITEDPVTRISRLIKLHFWDALTRRVDRQGMARICADPKNSAKDGMNRIYVPYRDTKGLQYFRHVAADLPDLKLDVLRLPSLITPQYVLSLNSKPGILALALRPHAFDQSVLVGVPFVVPGGRFNEMYGWDSYFEALGLICDSRYILASSMVDNFVYEIEHYGKILNANRSYYLARSQPPFLTDMIRQIYPHVRGTPQERKSWFRKGVLACCKELLSVWLNAPRKDVCGLIKYHPEGMGIPPETEPSHFTFILLPYAQALGVTVDEYIVMYNAGVVKQPELDEYLLHDRGVRESGHDTTYRLDGKCAHLCTVDLNSLVFKYQMDISDFLTREMDGTLVCRVRNGEDNVNLNGFKRWMELVRLKGVKDAYLDTEWDTRWAQGIVVLESDEFEDLQPESCEPINGELSTRDKVNEKIEKETDLNGVGLGNIESISSTLQDQKEHEKCYFNIRLAASVFELLGDQQRELVNRYLWCPKTHLFYDYNAHTCHQELYESVTCLWTLWAGLATPVQASLLVPRALELFEEAGGLVSGTKASLGRVQIDSPNRQWDYPFGWYSS